MHTNVGQCQWSMQLFHYDKENKRDNYLMLQPTCVLKSGYILCSVFSIVQIISGYVSCILRYICRKDRSFYCLVGQDFGRRKNYIVVELKLFFGLVQIGWNPSYLYSMEGSRPKIFSYNIDLSRF